MYRLLVCFLVAAALHVAGWLALRLVRELDLGMQAAIEVDLEAVPAPPNLDPTAPKLTVPPVAQKAELPPATAPKRGSHGSGGQPATTDLTPLAPLPRDGARLVVLVRMAELRKTPLRDVARSALALLPDYAMAVAAHIDPITDFDALLIATANPYDVTQTFLAALLGDPDKVRERLAPPGGGDPRALVFPTPEVAVLGRPEHIRSVGGAWIARLRAELGLHAREGLLEVTVGGLVGALDLGSVRIELPRLAVTRLGWPPALRAHLEYDTVPKAIEAEASWPLLSARVESSALIRLVGLGGITSRIQIHRAGSALEIETPLEQRHMEAIGSILQLAMERAHARWRNRNTQK